MKLVKIKSIKKILSNSKRYDIQTKNNNNFFANNVLVHNSLINVYYDITNNKWLPSTRKMAEAQGPVEDGGETFADLVDKACKCLVGDFNSTNINNLMAESESRANDIWKYCTFSFELVSPFNRVVCEYNETELYLLAVRNNNTLQELDPVLFAKFLGVKLPKSYSCQNINEMIEIVRSQSPRWHEGVVCKDKNFNRIKLKNPSYTAYNHISDQLKTSWRGCVELVVLGKSDDVIPMMPEAIQKRLLKVQEAVRTLFTQTEKDYSELKDIINDKEFALAAKEKVWMHALFALRQKKAKDLFSFVVENKNGAEIKISVLDSVLNLCIKVDPKLQEETL